MTISVIQIHKDVVSKMPYNHLSMATVNRICQYDNNFTSFRAAGHLLHVTFVFPC